MSDRYAGRSRYRMQALRKRRRRRVRRLLVFSAALLIMVGLVCTIRSTVKSRQAERQLQAELAEYADTFQPGVTINGTELTGYGYDEAHQLLLQKYAANIETLVTLTFEDMTWNFTPSQVNAQIDLKSQLDRAWAYGKNGTDEERQAEIHSLKNEPVDLSAELTFDREALSNFVAAVKQEIDRAPVDATRKVVDTEKFEFTDSAVGYSLNAETLEKQLEDFILNGGSALIEIEPEIIEPSVSRADMEAATVLLGECTTSLATSSSSRNRNVNRALGYFNFLEVAPGETVSFNEIVGKRTKKNGFSEAPEYAGTTVVQGIGGGVCQASTTIYGAVIRAGLEIVERHSHTMTVGYVAASQDAAVTNDDKDLKFKNTTENTLYFFARTDSKKEEAIVKIYGQPIRSDVRIDIVSEITQTDIQSTKITYQEDTEGTRVWYTDDVPVLLKKGKSGRRSVAYRVYYDISTGAEVEREKLSSDYYAPQDDVYLVGVHMRE